VNARHVCENLSSQHITVLMDVYGEGVFGDVLGMGLFVMV